MCVYCTLGDFTWRHNTPFTVNPLIYPNVPPPNAPFIPWKLDQIKEFAEILKNIKEMEDKIGCPCEPNKDDYIKILEEKIEKLENDLITPSEEEVADSIDAWNKSDSDIGLHTWLGWTKDEYAKYIKYGKIPAKKLKN